MAYQVRNQKSKEDDSYILTYGKGKKKLTAKMRNTSEGWRIVGGVGAHITPQKTMKECKTLWGEWAAVAYESDGASKGGSAESAPTPPTPPTPPVRKGPPSFKPPGPPAHKPAGGPPSHKPKMPRTLDFQFASDPFDPRFIKRVQTADGKVQKVLTPLGVLVEMRAWMERHPRCLEIAREHHVPENADPFYPLAVTMQECLDRELAEGEDPRCLDLTRQLSEDTDDTESEHTSDTSSDKLPRKDRPWDHAGWHPDDEGHG